MQEKNRGIERRKIKENIIFPITLDNGERIIADRRASHRRYNAYISEQQLFVETPYHLVEPVLLDCPVRQLQPGEVLIAKGQENHFLYLLTSGCLHIYFNLTDSKEVFVVEQGECVGEVSLFDGKPASAYVVAAAASEIIVIHEDVFWQKIAVLPSSAKNLLQLLGQRIRQSNDAVLKGLEQQLKHEQLQKELRVAAEIQMNMLPKSDQLFPLHPQIKAFGLMRPAKEIGGDFYDAFTLDDKHIVIAVGDVSGKGIPAALFMMKTMSLLRAKITKPKKFASALKTVNKSLCENNETNMFVTLFVGLLNVTTGAFHYANGGHLPPLLASRESYFFNFLKVPNNVLLGVYESATYEIAYTELQGGDTLVLYTDGVTEAENSQQEQFSIAKTIEVLTALYSADVKTMVNALSEEIDSFSKTHPQSDDITVLALQYLG